jgi:hypothetical protein
MFWPAVRWEGRDPAHSPLLLSRSTELARVGPYWTHQWQPGTSTDPVALPELYSITPRFLASFSSLTLFQSENSQCKYLCRCIFVGG